MITTEEVGDRIRKQLRGKLPADATIDDDTVLAELGLSSLQLSDIVFGLEEDHGIEFDDGKAADVKRIGDLVALANESLGIAMPAAAERAL